MTDPTARDWHPLIGFEGYYEITVSGLFRRIVGGSNRWKPGRLLTPFVGDQGYLAVRLSVNGVARNCFVHRLIAQNFLPDKPVGSDHINHKDGDKLNNSLDNLEWVTIAENNAHAIRTGLHRAPVGEANGIAKLDAERVIRIREERAAGRKRSDIAKQYGITVPTVRQIDTRQTWRHLP